MACKSCKVGDCGSVVSRVVCQSGVRSPALLAHVHASVDSNPKMAPVALPTVYESVNWHFRNSTKLV